LPKRAKTTTLLDVVGLQPGEPRAVEVDLPQRRGRPVDPVELADRGLHAGVAGVGELVPVERLLALPLGLLAPLEPLEEELLAGVRPHEAVERAEVRELLPLVARHLVEHGALPCTTSSCESGSMKFSVKAYTSVNVSSWWWYLR
jgi:hypothetical protein